MIRRAVLAALLAACVLSAADAEEDTTSTNFVMEGCRANVRKDQRYFTRGGLCYGQLDALGTVGPMLPEPYRFCQPSNIPRGQTVRIVAAYIDAVPHRSHENFTVLALEALRKAWPCLR